MIGSPPGQGLVVGIETGGTKIACAAGTGPEDLTDRTTFATTDPDATLARIGDYIAAHREGLTAIGVASFGPVDLRRSSPTYGHVTATPKPGWSGTDVVGPLRQRFGVPVGFDTDVNGAALAEGRWGAARGLGSHAYVTVGTGIGVGLVVDGTVVHGLVHPEAGHLLVRRHPDDPFTGRCPFHGDCLEGLAAGPALQARWGVPAPDLTGDTLARAVDLQAHYLGQLVAALVVIASPERIVLGGGVLELEGLLDATRLAAAALLGGYPHLPGGADLDEFLVRPALGDRAGVLGAVLLGLAAADG